MADEPQRRSDWTSPERWAWERIAAGESADFNARAREAESNLDDLDPTKPDGWSNDRRLSASFMQTVLTHPAFADATPFAGVRIVGALLDGPPLNLDGALVRRAFACEGSRILVPITACNLRIDGSLRFEKTFFAAELALRDAEIAGVVSLASATCCRTAGLQRVKIKSGLHLREGNYKAELDLANAIVGSSLDLTGSVVEGAVTLRGVAIESFAHLGHTVFKNDVLLAGAVIGADLNMDLAVCNGEIDLHEAAVSGVLRLRDVRVANALTLDGARIGSDVTMDAASFEGAVRMRDTDVGGAVVLRQASLRDVNANGASLGSDLVVGGSTFGGVVDLSRARVRGSALLRNSTFHDRLRLVHMSIDFNLHTGGSTFCRDVDMYGLVAGQAGFLLDGTSFEGTLRMDRASIGSDLVLKDGRFHGAVYVADASIKGDVLVGGAVIQTELYMVELHVGSTLDLTDADLPPSTDLTGARIDGELRLGGSSHQSPRWPEDASLVLRNAHCGALQDSWRNRDQNSWPKRIDLTGFVYQRLGGRFSDSSETDMLRRRVSDYAELLRRDRAYSPQPYEQLARVFREAGYLEKATDILFEGRERRRASLLEPPYPDPGPARSAGTPIANRLQWFGMSLLNWTIGYGLGGRYFRVLWWVFGLTLLGAVLLNLASVPLRGSGLQFIFLSLDELLPIITLDKAHEAILTRGSTPRPPEWLLAYFYVHKIAGWVLGSFLVAGLAGLTQRN